METVLELSKDLRSTSLACAALGISRATLYRAMTPQVARKRSPKPSSRALPPETRQAVLDHLHGEEFVDRSPSEMVHTLLDRGVYLASVRTCYRILEAHGEVQERRNQLRHPKHARPELIATGPNQVWCWDITKLKGPGKFVYYHLYVIIDIYSRYVVGWMLAHREDGQLAKQLIEETCKREGIQPNQLVIHSDRGAAMQSLPVVHLLAQLDILKSNSRPHVSNDNPFIESHFKTVKNHPKFPDRFGSYEDALRFCQELFRWYNHSHCHSGILFLTPAVVHSGRADDILRSRHEVVMKAFSEHPERFVNGPPKLKVLDRAVYINSPTSKSKKHVLGSSLN
jgi:putative transposase